MEKFGAGALVALVVVACFIGLVAFGGRDEQPKAEQESEISQSQKIEVGIVERTYATTTASLIFKAVLLENGKVFEECRLDERDNLGKFYFLEKGDTLYYRGEEVVRIGFVK